MRELCRTKRTSGLSFQRRREQVEPDAPVVAEQRVVAPRALDRAAAEHALRRVGQVREADDRGREVVGVRDG